MNFGKPLFLLIQNVNIVFSSVDQGNIALYKPTDQVSSYKTSYSSNAVDGGRQTNFEECAHTEVARDAWWRVDLGRVEDVAEVHILIRDSYPQHMYGAEIRVGR